MAASSWPGFRFGPPQGDGGLPAPLGETWRLGDPAFHPARLPGLALFVDPNDESTKTVDSGNVTAIRDKAQGLSFTVPAGANAPADSTHTTGDGRTVGALEFDSTNTEGLAYSSAIHTGAEPFTWVVVMRPESAAATMTPFSLNQAADASLNHFAIWVRPSGAGIWLNLYETSSSRTVYASSSHTTEPYVASFRRGGGALSGRIDGGAEPSGTDTVYPAPDRTCLGLEGANGLPFSGKVLLVLVYDRRLSDAELALVEDWAHRQKIHNPGAGIPAVGLVLDLDPSVSSSLTITSSPDVDAIANRAGKGLANLAQSTAANKPHLDSINGHGALLFDDAASQYLEAASAAFAAAPWHFVGVAKPDQAGLTKTIFDVGQFGTAFQFSDVSLTLGGSGPYTQRAYLQVADTALTTVLGDTTERASAGDFPTVALFAYGESATSRGVRHSGASYVANTTSRAVTLADRTALGRRLTTTADQYLSGRTGRCLLYKRKLSSAEEARAEAALSSFWGVSS